MKWDDVKDKILELLPDAAACACDKNGCVSWYSGTPTQNKDYNYWCIGDSEHFGNLGIYECDDWKNSLVVKKEKKWRPAKGCSYYTLMFSSGTYQIVRQEWRNDLHDKARLENYAIFKTIQDTRMARDKILEVLRDLSQVQE